MEEVKKNKRGFASMSPERRREIATKGGKAAHAMGRAHRFTSEEARAAGYKGGTKTSQNRQYMAEIGTRGGLERAKRRQDAKETDQSETAGKDSRYSSEGSI